MAKEKTSLMLSSETKQLLLKLAEKQSEKSGFNVSMSIVLELIIKEAAKKEKIKLP